MCYCPTCSPLCRTLCAEVGCIHAAQYSYVVEKRSKTTNEEGEEAEADDDGPL